MQKKLSTLKKFQVDPCGAEPSKQGSSNNDQLDDRGSKIKMEDLDMYIAELSLEVAERLCFHNSTWQLVPVYNCSCQE